MFDMLEERLPHRYGDKTFELREDLMKFLVLCSAAAAQSGHELAVDVQAALSAQAPRADVWRAGGFGPDFTTIMLNVGGQRESLISDVNARTDVLRAVLSNANFVCPAARSWAARELASHSHPVVQRIAALLADPSGHQLHRLDEFPVDALDDDAALDKLARASASPPPNHDSRKRTGSSSKQNET